MLYNHIIIIRYYNCEGGVEMVQKYSKEDALDQMINYAMMRKKKLLQDGKEGSSLKSIAKDVLIRDHSEMIIDSLRSNEPKKKEKAIESKEEFLERKKKELGLSR